MKKMIKWVMVAITATVLVLTGCSAAGLYKKTTPYTIEAAKKVSISFETNNNVQGRYGAFFVSGNGIPTPETGTTYNPIEIPANTEKTIRVRAFFGMQSIISWNKAWDIDKEFDFKLPPLQEGSYTIAYLFNTIGGGNKRLALKDSTGKVIQEIKVD
jgi:hypothetical protein